MPFHVKDAGVWKQPKDIWVKDAGVWKPVRRAFIKDAGVWKQTYQDEVVVTITANVAQTRVQADWYFTAADWANPLLNKRLVIAPGVYVWSYTPGVPALTVGAGRGGTLTIENNGTILGAGGPANSGVGGTALEIGQSGVRLINNDRIFGGGGGGGRGGNGGGGTYQSPYTATDGPYGSVSGGHYYYAWMVGYSGTRAYYRIYWNESIIYQDAGYGEPGVYKYSITVGGITYTPGAAILLGNPDYYQLYRAYTAYTTVYTNGGAGGSGGRGVGYDSGLNNVYTAGAGGAAGGVNAGTGGTGGAGGANWGLTGGTGGTGATGNYTGGLAGATGGLGGYYIYGYGNLESFINNGTVMGRAA